MFCKIKQLAQKLFFDENGATMVEYGLMLALIMLACIFAVTFVGQAASALFTRDANALGKSLGNT